MVCIKKQPYIYFVRLTFKNRHFFRYLTCLLDRGHIIAGGLFVSHLRSETDLKSQNKNHKSPLLRLMADYLLSKSRHIRGIQTNRLKAFFIGFPKGNNQNRHMSIFLKSKGFGETCFFIATDGVSVITIRASNEH